MQLEKLQIAIHKYEDEIYKALKEDLNKSKFETYMTEIGMVLEEISYIKKRIRKWGKPKKVKSPIHQFPASSKIYSEPYGVCLIMSPWNYPFQLSIAPLIGAIASGNCCIIKPSNYSPATSNLVDKIIKETFKSNYITVILGGREENQTLLTQKFDYIFFTGSVGVGKIVMESASKHLTPLSLELGGKSPCIVDETANLDLAAKRIIWGKTLNSGQTCVAPDYLLVHHSVKDELISKIKVYLKKFYGDSIHTNPIFPKIINEHHFNRLIELIKDNNVIVGGQYNQDTFQIEPTLVDNVSWDSPIMQEEIFGPILPVITFHDLKEVSRKVNDYPKPLALYFFTTSQANEKYVLNNISSGGGCINDTIVHLATHYLPFGGVGNSGMGSYHGKASFDTFSHKKSIMKRFNKFDLSLRYPPYDKKLSILKRFMK
jgi:aldehyde dehydrogenase (NAD+)